jgi:hypothetical protein
MEKSVEILLESTISGLHFGPHRPEGLRFIPKIESGLTLTLKPNQPESDPSGHRCGLVCQARLTRLINESQYNFIEVLLEGRKFTGISERFSLPLILNNKTLIDENGVCAEDWFPRLEICPQDIADILNNAEKELAGKMERFIHILRWRQNCDAKGNLFERHQLFLKTRGDVWRAAPRKNRPTESFEAMFGVNWSDEHEQQVQSLFEERLQNEPLGHALLREAIELNQYSVRSAILLLVTAIETGVKTHITKIAPDTAWLMEKIPSPAIDKLFKQYIPTLHKLKGTDLGFWGKLNHCFKNLAELIKIRNIIAHTGKMEMLVPGFSFYAVLTRDLLYIIDVLEGNEWAKTLVSRELRKALDWPEPSDARIYLEIQQL